MVDKPDKPGLLWGTGRNPLTGENFPIVLQYAGQSPGEIDAPALQEVEAKVRELDKLPLSVHTLAKALELIVAVTKANLDISLDEGTPEILRVKYCSMGGRYSNLTVENNTYVDDYMHCADMGRLEHKNCGTESVAWTIAGYYYPPRHFAAAIERLRREGKNIKQIPMQYLTDAANEEKLAGS
jgi:hypothetical protein